MSAPKVALIFSQQKILSQFKNVIWGVFFDKENYYW